MAGGGIILPEKIAWVHAVGGGFISPIKSDSVESGSPVIFYETKITDSNEDDSIITELPTISRRFAAKLSIKTEIKDLMSVDEHFKYILYNILKILDDIFDAYGNPGNVEVILELDEDNPNWKHADIKIKLDDDSLISEIWRKASKSTKEFYKATDARKIIPSGSLKRIHKFIYIVVD